jgi:subtilisin family serine protease
VTVLNSDGVGDLWTIGKGIAFAIDRGADVINLSLGSTYSSAILEDVVHEADLKGIVVAAAMGNMARIDPEEYPAGLTTVLAVCATDPVDGVATFSNFGPKADLCAPGTTLVAGGAVVTSQAVVGPVPGGRWAAWQGTSFATAFASGVAALVRAQHPEWPDATTPLAAIDDAIIESITGASVPIDSWCRAPETSASGFHHRVRNSMSMEMCVRPRLRTRRPRFIGYRSIPPRLWPRRGLPQATTR